jgi:hypothetical protein
MRSHTFHQLAVALAVSVTGLSAHSQTLSASCSEPKGTRFDQAEGSVKQNSDGFAGVNPQFVVSSSNPKRLTVIWPDSRSMGTSARQNAHEAVIIDSSPEMLTAIVLFDARATMYTLFPKRGIAYMSTHRQIDLGAGVQNGALFYMNCKFEGG